MEIFWCLTKMSYTLNHFPFLIIITYLHVIVGADILTIEYSYTPTLARAVPHVLSNINMTTRTVCFFSGVAFNTSDLLMTAESGQWDTYIVVSSIGHTSK